MYRVMIVDDEQLIRITLKNMLDWKALDCSILALAKDGQEAWQIFEEATPEIVITDLKMPKLDGIELIRRIKERSPDTQVIALSNHSDFELVKEAMKAGAFDYLLKITLEEDELKEVIEQVKEKCVVHKSSNIKRYEPVLERLQHFLILKKNDHEINMEETKKLLESALFDSFRASYQMAYFRVDNIKLYHQTHKEGHDVIRNNLSDLMTETIPNFMKFEMIFVSNHSGILIFQSKERLRILNICNTIMRNIAQYMDLQLSITLSETSHDLNEFFSIYAQLLERHEMRFYVGEGILIQAEELTTFNRLKMEDVDFHIRMLEAVNSRDLGILKEVHHESMMYMKENFIRPLDVLDYEIFILNNIEGNELSKGLKTSFGFQNFVTMIHQCETIDKLDQLLQEAFKQISVWLMDDGSNRYGKDITEVINYVEQNYTQKITLKMLAQEFNINESYLSRMFKSQTGKNLIYYVNEKKMRKAKELLSNPQIMVKQAAYAVGYDDQFYFNKLFKRFFGESPTEFRKRLSEQEKQEDEATS